MVGIHHAYYVIAKVIVPFIIILIMLIILIMALYDGGLRIVGFGGNDTLYSSTRALGFTT